MPGGEMRKEANSEARGTSVCGEWHRREKMNKALSLNGVSQEKLKKVTLLIK
jgi:hypothetical protein